MVVPFRSPNCTQQNGISCEACILRLQRKWIVMPIQCSPTDESLCYREGISNYLATARITRSASRITSGPMPSPGNVFRAYVLCEVSIYDTMETGEFAVSASLLGRSQLIMPRSCFQIISTGCLLEERFNSSKLGQFASHSVIHSRATRLNLAENFPHLFVDSTRN